VQHNRRELLAEFVAREDDGVDDGYGHEGRPDALVEAERALSEQYRLEGVDYAVVGHLHLRLERVEGVTAHADEEPCYRPVDELLEDLLLRKGPRERFLKVLLPYHFRITANN